MCDLIITKVEFNKKSKEKFIHDIMENYPEAGYGSCLECIDWNYDKCWFQFYDSEVNRKITVTKTMLNNHFDELINDILDGKLPGLSISAGNFTDAGQWDADCIDALVQYAIFGKCIYG